MDLEKVRLVVKNLESLVRILKEELEQEQDPPIVDEYDSITPFDEDYDEVYVDEI
jgi:hypothetical protein